MRTLSIIIPAYNEERTIGPLLERILRVPTERFGFRKEIVVVDDGSRDRTYETAASFKEVRCVRQENRGKGAAVQRGVKESTGDYMLVQDADLEYDPMDYLPMLEKVPPERPVAVYGSRTLGQLKQRGGKGLPGKHKDQGLGQWAANLILSFLILLLYDRRITDPLTAYKLYPLPLMRTFHVKTHGFETDHELTAKLSKQGIPIFEVPVSYVPRSVQEGKKIRPRDGLIAVWTLLKFRWMN